MTVTDPAEYSRFRVRIESTTDYDPAEYLSGAELVKVRADLAAERLYAVSLIVQSYGDREWFDIPVALSGIEICPEDVKAAFPGDDYLYPDEIPYGPYNPLSFYGAESLSEVSTDLVTPDTASGNYLVQTAADLFAEARKAF